MAKYKSAPNSKNNQSNKNVKHGRIGKPQKSHKHKIKSTNRNSSLDKGEKGKKSINHEPGKDDDQWIPRRVKEMMWAQEQIKNGKKKKKKNKRKPAVNNTDRGVTKPLEKEPKFVQRKKESIGQFMDRVNHETRLKIYDEKAKAKLKDDVIVSESTEKPAKLEGKKERNREKRKLKAEAIQMRKLEKKGDFAEFVDHVQFGEIVEEPPSLTAKPRKATSKDGKDRPGKRSLLLNQMFETKDTDAEPEIKQGHKSLAMREVGKTMKRKHLSFAQQRINDAQRDKAIQLYRKFKANKMKGNND